jgi:hypothetical protein
MTACVSLSMPVKQISIGENKRIEIKFFRQGQALQQLIVPSNAASLVLSFRSRCSRRLIVLILPKTMVTIHTYTPNCIKHQNRTETLGWHCSIALACYRQTAWASPRRRNFVVALVGSGGGARQ